MFLSDNSYTYGIAATHTPEALSAIRRAVPQQQLVDHAHDGLHLRCGALVKLLARLAVDVPASQLLLQRGAAATRHAWVSTTSRPPTRCSRRGATARRSRPETRGCRGCSTMCSAQREAAEAVARDAARGRRDAPGAPAAYRGRGGRRSAVGRRAAGPSGVRVFSARGECCLAVDPTQRLARCRRRKPRSPAARTRLARFRA